MRPDLHKQIIELLNHDYKISPDQILVNVNQITFDKIPKMDSSKAQNYNNVIPLNVNRPKVAKYSDSQIQTDLSFKDIKVKGQMNAVYSEVEILGFTYMTDEERNEHLKSLLSDECPIEKYSYDPCTEVTSFIRYNDPSIPVPRARSISSNRKQVPVAMTKSTGSQTLYTSSSIHRSTQTINDYSNSTTSTENSPLHQFLITKTKATIKTDSDGTNRIKEKFTLQNKKDQPIGYTQLSEYQTNIGKNELIKSSLNIDKIDQNKKTDNAENNEDLDKKKLVKSTMEMTSVINNKTTVTGISGKDAPEKFTIQIINPENDNETIAKPQDFAENLQLNSNNSSPRIDKKITEDIYKNEQLFLAQKPFNLKCDDDNVIQEENLGFNNNNNDLSIRNTNKPKNLSTKLILQSNPDLSKNINKAPEYSIRQLPSTFKFNQAELRKNHSEKNIPNNPELNDSFTQIENPIKQNSAAFITSSPRLDPKAPSYIKIPNKQNDNDQFKINPRRETGFDFKKKLIDQKNLELEKINTNVKIDGPKGDSVLNFKKSLMASNFNQNEKFYQPGENSIKQTTEIFKKEQLTKEPNTNFKKSPNMNDSYRFSIDKIPKMFRYDQARDPEPITPNPKLGLSDDLRQKLNQNDMVLVEDQNVSPRSIIKQRNTSQGSYTQKQFRKVDFNENIIDVDFEAYEKPRIRQKVIEIEEPISSIDSERIERASFRTDSTNSSRPEVKDRKRAPQEHDIIYDKFVKPTKPSTNFKQKLLSKNQIVS